MHSPEGLAGFGVGGLSGHVHRATPSVLPAREEPRHLSASPSAYGTPPPAGVPAGMVVALAMPMTPPWEPEPNARVADGEVGHGLKHHHETPDQILM